MNVENEFVKYEQASALKELGFDESCLFPYNEEGNLCWNEKVFHNIQNQRYDFPIFEKRSLHYIGIRAPLYQQAFKWFRNSHNLCGEIYTINMGAIDFSFMIRDLFSEEYIFDNFVAYTGGYNGTFETYEEAELACLIKLIEIVKSK